MSFFGYYLFKQGEFDSFCEKYGLQHKKTNNYGELHGNSGYIGFNKINLDTNNIDLFSCHMTHSSAYDDNDLKELFNYRIDNEDAREICINKINFKNKKFVNLTHEKQFLEIYKSDIYTVYSNGEVHLYYDGLIKLFRDLGLPSLNDSEDYSLDKHTDFLIYETQIEKVKNGYIVDIMTNEIWEDGFEFTYKCYLEMIHDGESEILCKVHNLE